MEDAYTPDLSAIPDFTDTVVGSLSLHVGFWTGLSRALRRFAQFAMVGSGAQNSTLSFVVGSK
jgi:hypothetical protein